MPLPFREVGVGNTPELAFEYAQLKNSFKRKQSGIEKKETIQVIRLPDNMTSSKLELKIWIAHLVPELKKHRHLSSTESKSYQWVLEEYGIELGQEILSQYGDHESKICLAIPMSPAGDESAQWRRRTHRVTTKNGKVVSVERVGLRKSRGDVWKFIGQT